MSNTSAYCRASKFFVSSTVGWLLASSLASADSKILEDYPAESTSGHTALDVDGVKIWIKPLVNKNTIRDYFGKELRKRKIVPIHVLIENGSARNILFDAEVFSSSLGSDIANDLESQKQLKKREVSGAKLQRRFSFIPAAMYFGGRRLDKAGRTLHAVSKRAVRSQTIGPGESVSGFVYLSSDSLHKLDTIENSDVMLAVVDSVAVTSGRPSIQLIVPDDICILTEDESPWIESIRLTFGEGLCTAIHDSIEKSGLVIGESGGGLTLAVARSDVTMAAWGVKQRELFVVIEWSVTTSDGKLIWTKPAIAAIARIPAKTIVSDDFVPLFASLVQNSVFQLKKFP